MKLPLSLLPSALTTATATESRNRVRQQPVAQFAAHRQLQTLDQVCTVLAEEIEHPNGPDADGTYWCDCTGNTTEFTAWCHYDRYECATWPSSSSQQSSAFYTIEYSFQSTYQNGELTSPNSEECLYFPSTCNQVCVGYHETEGFYASMDGVRCNSMQLCQGGTHELDFVLDCENILPDMYLNTCNGTGVEGSPFEFFDPKNYDASRFTSGSCGTDNAIPRGLDPDNCLVVEANRSLEQVCDRYAQSVEHPNGGTGDYSCECEGESIINFEASCLYDQEECVQSPASPSWRYSVNYTWTTPFRNSVESGELEECIYYKDTCNTVCLGWNETTGYYATVDGSLCQSMALCNEGQTLDFTLDCTNLLPEAAVINTCTGDGVEGSPFQVFEPKFYSQSVYSSGSCSKGRIPLGLFAENCFKDPLLPSQAPSEAPSHDPNEDQDNNFMTSSAPTHVLLLISPFLTIFLAC